MLYCTQEIIHIFCCIWVKHFLSFVTCKPLYYSVLYFIHCQENNSYIYYKFVLIKQIRKRNPDLQQSNKMSNCKFFTFFLDLQLFFWILNKLIRIYSKNNLVKWCFSHQKCTYFLDSFLLQRATFSVMHKCSHFTLMKCMVFIIHFAFWG